MSGPDRPRLVCLRCRAERGLDGSFTGCPVCATHGPASPLEVAYDLAGLRAAGVLDAWTVRPGGLWRFRELLPLPADAVPVTLAEGATPLVPLEDHGEAGAARVWLKDETRNPTGAFKDRFHAVSLAMARVLGYDKAVAATTGNHGTALSAYAARAGLRALAFCDPRTPAVQRRLMQLYGAHVAVLADREAHLEWLVRERGWYPSTGTTPTPVGTPYGVEGYKTIAFEIYLQLGGRFPSRVLVPTSGGDAVYGPWKGFRELSALGAAGTPPRMTAVQAAGCDPIVQGWRAGATEVPVHPDPRTIAVSIGDATGGAIALAALRESGGGGEAVSDAAIVAAVRRLARQGIVAEPSSAASVAAALALADRGELAPGEDVVCVLTGSGVKWPEALGEIVEAHELMDANPTTVRAWIEAFVA